MSWRVARDWILGRMSTPCGSELLPNWLFSRRGYSVYLLWNYANRVKVGILKSLLAMKKLTLEFTVEELSALTDMASNQLFRKQFIDPKMPGFVPNQEELGLCKNLVGRLRTAMDVQRGKIEPPQLQKRKAEAR